MKRISAEVLSSRTFGDHQSITIVAPEIAERVRPGQFVQVAMPPDREFILRRPFAVAKASREGGWAGTLEFAFRSQGAAADWLGSVRAHQFLDVIGPLGKGFAAPKSRTTCLLVGESVAIGQLYFLAEELRGQGKRVDMIVWGRSQGDVYKPIEGKRLAQTFALLTGDGSMGLRASIEQALPGIAERCGSDVIYAAGSRSMLRAVARFAQEVHIPSQVAVQESMGCGWGQCFTCVIPMVRRDGAHYDNVRSCTEGPVFNSSRVAWDVWFPPAPARPIDAPSPEGADAPTDPDTVDGQAAGSPGSTSMEGDER